MATLRKMSVGVYVSNISDMAALHRRILEDGELSRRCP